MLLAVLYVAGVVAILAALYRSRQRLIQAQRRLEAFRALHRQQLTRDPSTTMPRRQPGS